jgi:cation transport ATPase
LTAGAAASSATAGPVTLAVTDDRVFGPGGEALARRFARRVLRFSEVRALSLNPPRATATLSYRLGDVDVGAFLSQLADAVAGGDEGLDEAELPHWPGSEPVTLHRRWGIVSTIEILSLANGCLDARHPAIKRDPAIAHGVENALRVVPGVISATATTAKAELRVRFDPRAVAASELIRLAEAEILGQRDPPVAPSPEPADFRLANVSLGLAATGELVLPAVTPLTAGLLVLSNLETFGAAATQLHRHEIGLPLLYTSIVGVTLASGQFLSAALMLWFFRYWEQRYRQDLTVESQALLDVRVGLPQEARVLTADGLERVVPSREISIGQRVRAVAGDTIPVDAIVRGGAALVDETALCGTLSPSRKVAGDQVLAGSKLLVGAFDLEVLHTGRETRAARIEQAQIETTVPAPRAWALNRDAEEFAGRAVAPTLFAAGAGLLVGDVTTAGAVLRPDYATGVGLAMPLETVRDVRFAMRNGAVLGAGDALKRLATTSWIVLDDHPALHHTVCDVAEVQTKWLDEARLLPAMAAAGVWLGDERGPALARACRERGLVVRRAALREINGDGVAIGFGDRLLRLRGRPAVAGAAPPLTVEVDGTAIAGVRFVRNGRPEAAEVVRRLQRRGMRFFLASEHAVAKRLGIDHYCGNMSADDKIRFLRDLRRQSIGVAYIGDCLANAPVAREARLSIGLAAADAGWEQGPSDIALLAPSIAPLPALCALARDSARRQERARYTVMVPNLVCVAGAFAFGFTPMAAVLLSNLGTSLAYNGAKRRLREAAVMRLDDAWYADDEPGRSFVPNTERAEIRTGG